VSVKRLFLIGSCFVALTAASAAQAGDCAVRVWRTSEPGQEAQALAPFGGKNPTATMVPMSSQAACKDLAIKMCPVKKPDLIVSKEVKAKFDGADLDDGKDLCPQATAAK
jgi:hypothetical protein